MKKQIATQFLVAALASSFTAADVFRYHQSGNWSQASNNSPGWGLNPNNPAVSDGSLPMAGDDARINFGNNLVTVDSDVPDVANVQIGVDESGRLEVNDGGILTASNDVRAGNNNANATGMLTVNDGGVVNVGRILWAAHQESDGVINLNSGGTITVASHLWLGVTGTAQINISGTLTQTGGILGLGTVDAVNPGGGTATLNVNDGGLLALNNIHGSGTSIQPGSVLNINGTGQVTLPNDFVGVITDYINDAKITGNGTAGLQAVKVDTTTNPGFTTITAAPVVEPNDDPLVISEISVDAQTGDISLTWNSLDTEAFMIRYGLDLVDFSGELEESYSADAGLSTTYTFNQSDLLGAPTDGPVFFQVERASN